ncbi:MAG TPA: hypothetical protein VJ933_00125 [Phaeodactylibacter sp.]|nr:hypothetical protein [Phaeodactylibacter sp.]
MIFSAFAYAIIIAFLLALLVSGLTKSKGPWDNFWALFFVLALSIWVASLWITPIGPRWYGVAWADLLIVGTLLVLLIASTSEASQRYRRRYSDEEEVDIVAESKKDTTAITLFGVFFWIFIASLVVLAVVAIANWG